MTLEKDLINILVCPQTGGRLIWHAPTSELISLAARCAYPVRNGVPVMLADEARSLSQEEYEQLQ